MGVRLPRVLVAGSRVGIPLQGYRVASPRMFFPSGAGDLDKLDPAGWDWAPSRRSSEGRVHALLGAAHGPVPNVFA